MRASAAAKKIVENDVYNTSELSRGFGIDRSVVKKRLEAAGIHPIDIRAKETTYELTDHLEAVLLASDSDIDAERLRKIKAEADITEFKAKTIVGQLVPAVEVVDMVQKLFGSMHRELAVRMPKEISARLAKAKTSAAVQKILKTATDRRFKTLRDNFEEFLK